MKLFELLKRLSLARRSPSAVPLTIRMTPEVHTQLSALAAGLGESQNWVVTRLIMLAYEQMRKEGTK